MTTESCHLNVLRMDFQYRDNGLYGGYTGNEYNGNENDGSKYNGNENDGSGYNGTGVLTLVY